MPLPPLRSRRAATPRHTATRAFMHGRCITGSPAGRRCRGLRRSTCSLAVGELALYMAYLDGWPLRQRVWPWATALVGLAVSVAGNIGHIQPGPGHQVSLTDRMTAATSPLAAFAGLTVGLLVLRMNRQQVANAMRAIAAARVFWPLAASADGNGQPAPAPAGVGVPSSAAVMDQFRPPAGSGGRAQAGWPDVGAGERLLEDAAPLALGRGPIRVIHHGLVRASRLATLYGNVASGEGCPLKGVPYTAPGEVSHWGALYGTPFPSAAVRHGTSGSVRPAR